MIYGSCVDHAILTDDKKRPLPSETGDFPVCLREDALAASLPYRTISCLEYARF